VRRCAVRAVLRRAGLTLPCTWQRFRLRCAACAALLCLPLLASACLCLRLLASACLCLPLLAPAHYPFIPSHPFDSLVSPPFPPIRSIQSLSIPTTHPAHTFARSSSTTNASRSPRRDLASQSVRCRTYTHNTPANNNNNNFPLPWRWCRGTFLLSSSSPTAVLCFHQLNPTIS
jgi:hypothetical protein